MEKKTWSIIIGILVVVLIIVLMRSGNDGTVVQTDEEQSESEMTTEVSEEEESEESTVAAPATKKKPVAPAAKKLPFIAPDGAYYIYLTTGNVFDPAFITIKQGQTVRFVNKSSQIMDVQSNDHPTHNELPSFGQSITAGTGGEYTRTFTEVGAWGYHNHLSPSAMGTIVVVPQ